ncbi:MAG: hypothetical protein KA403_06535 [Candidatus Omnitrophica bacterium]|nr:hypothetical protein [Candidatus Omnitrophota bacterium]
MLKKILAAFIMFSFCLSIVPKEAFCNGHHQEMESTHEHCSVTCQSCFSAVLLPAQVSSVSLEFASVFQPVQVFSYQNPVITRLKRPPIRIS